MPKEPLSLQEALMKCSRESLEPLVARAREERETIQRLFPIDQWPELPVERYALGTDRPQESFSYWLEFRPENLGSIRGGSALKMLIYKHKSKPGWYYNSKLYKNEREAWNAIRGAFCEAFEKAKTGDWNSIDEIEALSGGPALRAKVLHVYFPDDIIPVYSKNYLLHFLNV